MYWPEHQEMEMAVTQSAADAKNETSQPRGSSKGLLGTTPTSQLLSAVHEEEKPKVSTETPHVHHFFGSFFRFRADSMTLAEDGDFSSWGVQLQMLSDYDLMTSHVVT